MTKDTNNPAMRMQVAEYGRLVAEVVVEYGQHRDLFERLTMAKWLKGLPFGFGAVICRADLPRQWDVPVGSRITGAGR